MSQLRVDDIVDSAGTGSPGFSQGITVTGNGAISGNVLTVGDRLRTEDANSAIRLGSSADSVTLQNTGVVIGHGITNHQLYLTRSDVSGGTWLYGNAGFHVAKDNGLGGVGTVLASFLDSGLVGFGRTPTEQFEIFSATEADLRVVIESGGTNPKVTLELNPSSNSVQDGSIGNSSLSSGSLFLIHGNDTAGRIRMGFGTVDTSGVPSTEVMVIRPDGVCIDGDTPGNTLDVATNTVRIRSLTSTDPLATNASGDIIAGSSDSRLKDNVADYTSGLSVLAQLRPVSYTWKDSTMKPAGTPDIGFLAQEVELLIPEAVGQREQLGLEDCRTFSTDKLMPAVVKSIQELLARVEALEL